MNKTIIPLLAMVLVAVLGSSCTKTWQSDQDSSQESIEEPVDEGWEVEELVDEEWEETLEEEEVDSLDENGLGDEERF